MTRESIHLDFLYDSIMFASEKGFPWGQVSQVMSTAEELLTGTKGKTLVEAVKLYQEQSIHLIERLGERNFQIYTEFVFSTFMTHFKLFQFVFNVNREELIPKVSRTVACPPSPVALREAKLDYIWEYEQEYNSIESKEKEKCEKWTKEQKKVAKQSAQSLASVREKLQTVESPLTKESVAEIIKDILGTSALATTERIKTSISQTMEDLELKLERTLIPRPQAMGPPPRFNQSALPQLPEAIRPAPVTCTKAPKPEKGRPKSRESTRSNKSTKSGQS
ncbi:uncharacterized protein C8orf74 homolog isoform X2 [Liolophura sinensis]